MVSRNLRFRFTLVSYNILSQSLLTDHNYLYTSCNPKDLEWPRRGHRIVSELLHNQADIICLQEVESEHLRTLYRPKLARYGYECLYKKKTGYKIDGCAIFYKSKLFHLSQYKGIEFNRTDVANLLSRDNVGIIAVLKPRLQTKSKSSHLVIANTHLIFNPKRCDIKLAQLKFFLSEIERMSLESYDEIKNERCHYPTILCGDLNSTPDSDVSRFVLKNSVCSHDLASCNHGIDATAMMMSQQGLDENPRRRDSLPRQTCSSNDASECLDDDEANDNERGHGRATLDRTSDSSEIGNASQDDEDGFPCCKIRTNENLNEFSHSLQFESVYPTVNKDGQSYVSTFSSCIVDYIFFTPKLRLNSYRELLTEEELRQVGPLPNEEFPSDHLNLEARFTLK